MDTQTLSRTAQRAIEKIDEKIEVMRQMRDCAEKLPDGLDVCVANDRIVVSIRTLYQLHETRKALRQAFGHWEDHVKIWCSGSWAYVSWKNSDIPYVVIWMSCSVADFPEELKGDTCRFEKVERTEYQYVCEARREG